VIRDWTRRAGTWLHGQWRRGAAIDALMLVAAFALKRAYSTAGADALSWVLVPSCRLARLLDVSDLDRVDLTDLAPEPGAGFISHASHMVVGAPCAGVNFLVVAWLALYFSGQASCAGMRRKLGWLCACGLCAYAATIATNGLRIVLAAHLYAANVYSGVLTKARVHRILGVALYCGALLLACPAAERCAGPRRASRTTARLSPLLWYFGIVLLVPLADRAWARDPARFAEHAAITLAMGFAAAAIAWLLGTVLDRVQSRHTRP
jgi:exosortase K